MLLAEANRDRIGKLPLPRAIGQRCRLALVISLLQQVVYFQDAHRHLGLGVDVVQAHVAVHKDPLAVLVGPDLGDLVPAFVGTARVVAEEEPRLVAQADGGLHEHHGILHAEAVFPPQDLVGVPGRVVHRGRLVLPLPRDPIAEPRQLLRLAGRAGDHGIQLVLPPQRRPSAGAAGLRTRRASTYSVSARCGRPPFSACPPRPGPAGGGPSPPRPRSAAGASAAGCGRPARPSIANSGAPAERPPTMRTWCPPVASRSKSPPHRPGCDRCGRPTRRACRPASWPRVQRNGLDLGRRQQRTVARGDGLRGILPQIDHRGDEVALRHVLHQVQADHVLALQRYPGLAAVAAGETAARAVLPLRRVAEDVFRRGVLDGLARSIPAREDDLVVAVFQERDGDLAERRTG